MKCGNCGSDSFEVAMGQRICNICEAVVPNEVAAAIELAVPAGFAISGQVAPEFPSSYKFPDVSRYRTVADWETYCQTYPTSACKASEGTSHRDPSFPNWRTNMRQRDCLPIAYHFLRSTGDIRAQVDNFLATVFDGAKFGIMLDIETAGDGSNPTVAQANAWFQEVSIRTNVPVSRMLCYMPRWWWQAYGGGSAVLAPTILWNSHFSSDPNISDYAGDKVEVIQYSSTAPIAGLAAPGTGDMNSAIGLTAEQFISKLTGNSTGGLSMADIDVIVSKLNDLYNHINVATGNVYNQVNRKVGEELANTDAEVAKVLERIDALEAKIATPPPVQVDATLLAEALEPVIQRVVDAELDKRTISLRTD